MDRDGLLDAAVFQPDSVQFPNSWVGHLPFSFWLTQQFSPRVFVELGTHSGNSYFSFCQAVRELSLPTRCYAVDTWEGDEHAGSYSEEVFTQVDAYHQQHYAEFSRLLRTTFDEAVTYFEDESVDLLHIDGLHTYEAVRHDFETWLPKLAPGAVVVFHDTNVRERNFGVWRFWTELEESYPNNLNFVHSHGLGVLQLNNAPADRKLEWLQPDFPHKERLKAYFSALGRQQLARFDWLELKRYTTDFERQTAKRITELEQTVQSREAQVTELEQTVQSREARIAELDLLISTRDAHIEELFNSRSWRVTRPLRAAMRLGLAVKSWALGSLVKMARAAKKKHHLIPLSNKTKRKIYRWLCIHHPQMVGMSTSSPAAVASLREYFVQGTVLRPGFNTLENIQLANDAHINVSDTPLVSIVIPVYGERNYTLQCLQSISAQKTTLSFEVIVVDDCSLDDSFTVLSSIQGLRLLKNETNQGFIRSCNAGAQAARGRYLCFLNNDTEVAPGWLDELVQTFDTFPGTGLVGSKLIYPDGRLQEAGGLIWQDGSAWNVGRFQDPNLPAYNYAREVDYCSGASIMVPRDLFQKLGGFDEHYLPAYCEDSDLALKVRDQGYRVIYQPLSTVIHYEGVTSGTDVEAGTKSYQIVNSKKLYQRWKGRLANHQPPGHDADNAKDRRATRRVLVLDHCTPTPDQDAGSVTALNLMLLLREMDFQVTFIPDSNFLYMPDYTTALQRAGIEALYGPYVISVVQHLKEYGHRYNLVLMIRPDVVEEYLDSVKQYCPQAKTLFETADLHFLRMQREADLYQDSKRKKAANDMKDRELQAISAVDATIIRSTAELDMLEPLVPDASLHVFPLILNVAGTARPYSERQDIIFVGGYQHTPNIDAVQYFATDVMPILRELMPGVRFYAVGAKPPADIQQLAADDILITGFVADLMPLLDSMRVSVAPLRYGAGIKGKIGTAMAAGLPVVATTLAAEGMSLVDEENILIADDPQEFAEAIVRLYQDESLWMRLSNNSLDFAEKTWGAEPAWETLAGILTSLEMQVKRSAHPLSLYIESRTEVSIE